ncbi:hypothetical protein MUK42_13914 [Musa troglodytarum]|uniref:Uncharacterized protein n=1 Tax=Musa troglodytarum TaxID=320322 RepID=A0A9E7I3G6_9LILI|nr:hypothetical protein MUK42_13914 [Musa troglodytarum]
MSCLCVIFGGNKYRESVAAGDLVAVGVVRLGDSGFTRVVDWSQPEVPSSPVSPAMLFPRDHCVYHSTKIPYC